MFGWGMTATATCPNCGHTPYDAKDNCANCGFLKPNTTKLDEAYLIFCKTCGCHYVSQTKACPLHGSDSIKN